MKFPQSPEPERDHDGVGDRATSAVSERALHDRLPAFYREERELLSPFVDAAEDLLAQTAASFQRRELQAGNGNPFGLAPSSVRRDWATPSDLADFCLDRHGVPPLVWNGIEAMSHAAGGLVFRRARIATAVLAWEKAMLPALPTTFRLPRRGLPAGVSVQVVILGRLPRQGGPRIGERFAGEVVFRATAGEVEVESW